MKQAPIESYYDTETKNPRSQDKFKFPWHTAIDRSQNESNKFEDENDYDFEEVTSTKSSGIKKKKGRKPTATINITKSSNIVRWKIDEKTSIWLEAFLAKQKK